jgi:hypothetical protein
MIAAGDLAFFELELGRNFVCKARCGILPAFSERLLPFAIVSLLGLAEFIWPSRVLHLEWMFKIGGQGALIVAYLQASILLISWPGGLRFYFKQEQRGLQRIRFYWAFKHDISNCHNYCTLI